MSTIYFACASIQFNLLAAATRLFIRNPHWVLIPFLTTVTALVYDNLVIGLGHMIGPGRTLMLLNYPRYITHATASSFFGLVGLYLAQQAGVTWAKQRTMIVTFWGVTLLALGRGIYVDMIKLDMVPNFDMGTLRYSNAATRGLPLPEMATILMVMVSGLGIAIHNRWPWLFVGSLTMFVMAGLARKIGIMANIGEMALVAGIVVTGYHFLNTPPLVQADPLG
ncbi:hypothetical protein [Candidatus Oscillochloris fontis]|uniref:hypothetical protein n=1 Tax=Candidatus Oscillochloris fontis TaxID=2496868 RepID=UPI00101D18DA|nr:hypothetical protein [Candidatus Oscillochloris fontis]